MTRSIALSLLLASTASAADTVKWIGAGLTDNWTNPNNWLGLNRPDNPSSDTVRFAGDHARTFSDVNEDFSINEIVFEYDDLFGLPVGRSYTVGGTGLLTLRDGVMNSTNLAQTITAPIRLGSGSLIRTAEGYSGSLTVGAINLNNWPLSTYASSGGLNFNGPITGSGSNTFLFTSGEGITRFNAASSWTGMLSVGGTVEYAFGSALGSTGVHIQLSGILRRTTTGTNVLNVSVFNTGTLDVPTGLTVTHTGTFTSSGATLAKTGAGTLVLTNTVTGLGQINVSSGRMRLESLTSLSNTSVGIAGGATLEYARTPDDIYSTLSGAGVLQFNAGGRVQVGSGTTFAGAGRFDGAIQGANARFDKAGIGQFELRGASTYTGGTSVLAGTLLLNNTTGSATGTGAITVSPNSTLGGDGAASGVVTLQNLAVLAPSNRNSPGAGLGSLDVGGLLMQAGSILQIELGASGTSDLLTVNGDATLNGTLALSRLANINLGDALPRRIVNVTGTMSGAFQAITGREQSPTEWFAVVFGPRAIDVVRADPGDTSLDGSVDFIDLLTLAQNYGQTTGRTWLTGDFTGDGATDFQDLLLTAQNYGPASVSGFDHDWLTARTLVPEPTTLAMLSGAALLGLRRRRAEAPHS